MSKHRSLFEKKKYSARAWREVIIFKKGNLSISFRASRLLSWPLKGNGRLLFLMRRPPVPPQGLALPFIENNNLFKTMKGKAY